MTRKAKDPRGVPTTEQQGKFPLTRRTDGRWQKVFRGKRYYFRGTEEKALAQWEELRRRLTQEDAPTCPEAEECQLPEVQIPLDQILPSPENERLYRPITTDDPEVQELADSIRQHGVLQACMVTADVPHRLIAGHRRTAAAKLAGLTSVPCKVLPVQWEAISEDDRIKLLREHNRYRHKNVQEQIREQMLDTDPEAAVANLRRLRRGSVFRPEINGIRALEIEGSKRRCRISDQKAAHVEHVKQVVFYDRRAYWPLSVRGIHYALLNYS